MKNFNLLDEKEIIVCAHQGTWSGNIPGNSLTAFDVAIKQGAQMIELDVTKSVDGELFVFHPTMEKRMLGQDIDISSMKSEDIKKLRFVNVGGGYTSETVQTLDNVFEHLKGRCYINVDKFADNPCEIMHIIKKHKMLDQIVVKSDPIASVLQKVEEFAPDIQYLAIINDDYDPYQVHKDLMQRKLNYVGLEVVFKNDFSPLANDSFIEVVHADHKLLWGNAILFDSRYLLAGQHSDDTALKGDPDNGWGWFIDKGFDIIQTDWTRELNLYLNNEKRRVKKYH